MGYFSAFSCRIFLAAAAAAATASGLRAQAVDADTISDSEIYRQFQQRRTLALDLAIAPIDPKNTAKGGVMNVATCFYRRTDLDWANARLALINKVPPTGDMFWMYPMAAVMEAGADVMSPANRASIRQLWRTYFPYRGDTENHWLMYYSSLYLAAQSNPESGPGEWYNGKSAAENMAEARSYIEDWMGIATNYGQGEFSSTNYIEEYAAPLGLLAGWAQDPELRQRAKMMLDYIFYDYAVEELNGEYGGAHSRIYPWQVVQPGHSPAAALGWLLFGFGDYQASGATSILAMCGYTPPPILYRIAHDRSRPYTDIATKRTRWQMRHAVPTAFEIEGKTTQPVYKYTYMDPDYVIGSCQGGVLQPIQQEGWSLIWREKNALYTRENTFFGLQPYSSPLEGTKYFGGYWDTVTDLISRSKADYDSPDKLAGGSPCEQIYQQGPALIALYDMPADNRFPEISTFFSRDLARRVPDPSGWIFCQGGPAYFAYYPLAPGEWKPMGWTGLLRGGAGGWFSVGYAAYSKGDQCLVSSALKNGYVVQVAAARDYASYAAFEQAVRALPLRFTLRPAPEVFFRSLDGSEMHARYGDRPHLNGAAVDYAAWPFFDSPFGHAARASGQLDITYGSEHYVLDFNAMNIKDIYVPTAP